MALNSLGLPLVLQASNQQVQDLMSGLKAGDLLRGRLVDLLPGGKAVLNLQGQNLLAQLPPASSGQVFQKGALLMLQVTQAAPNPAPSNSSPAPSPAPAGQNQPASP